MWAVYSQGRWLGQTRTSLPDQLQLSVSDVCQENTGGDPAQERQEDQAAAQQGGPVLHWPRGLRGLHADTARHLGGPGEHGVAAGFLLPGQMYPRPDEDVGQPTQPVRVRPPDLRDPTDLVPAGTRGKVSASAVQSVAAC